MTDGCRRCTPSTARDAPFSCVRGPSAPGFCALVRSHRPTLVRAAESATSRRRQGQSRVRPLVASTPRHAHHQAVTAAHPHPAARLASSLLSGALPDLREVVAPSADLDAAAFERLGQALQPLSGLVIESVTELGPHEAVVVGTASGTRWRIVIGVATDLPDRLTDIDFHRVNEAIEWNSLPASVRIAGDTSPEAERVGRFLAEVRDERRISGLSAAVTTRSTYTTISIGFADPWARAPVEASSRFRYSSLLKPWTAALVLRAVDAGVLPLDAPVGRWCPVDLADGITVRHLLTHTSGLDPMWPMPIHSTTDPGSAGQRSLLAATGIRSIAPPGGDAAYSNVGYGLLGLILEEVTGRPFTDLLMEFTRALGCADTSLEEDERCATGTALEGGAIVPVPAAHPILIAASGGWGTVDDLLRFANAVIDGRDPISPAVRRHLLEGLDHGDSHPGSAPLRPVRVGGVATRVCVGGWPGFSGALALSPGTGLAIAVLANRSVPERGHLPIECLKAALNG